MTRLRAAATRSAGVADATLHTARARARLVGWVMLGVALPKQSGEFKSSSAYRTHARIALPPSAEAPSSGLTLGRTISSLGTFWKRAASGLNSGVSMNWR